MGRVISVLQVILYWVNLGRLGPNVPNHVQGHMKSNPKYSALYFTPIETLLYCQGPLWAELYLFHRYLGIGEIWINWPQNTKRMCSDTQKVTQSF